MQQLFDEIIDEILGFFVIVIPPILCALLCFYFY